MTEVQIKRKAKTYSKNYWYNTNNSVNVASIEKLLIDFATEVTKELQEQIEKNNKFLEAVNYDAEKVPMLEAQIEKMKCWCNCKNYLSCLKECCRKNISFEKGICYNCKKWELRR